MTELTLAEAEEQLSAVNAAISEYVAGKRRKSLKIGTNEFMRAHDFLYLTYEQLLAERRRLQQIISDLTVVSSSTNSNRFKQNNHVPLIVTKAPV